MRMLGYTGAAGIHTGGASGVEIPDRHSYGGGWLGGAATGVLESGWQLWPAPGMSSWWWHVSVGARGGAGERGAA